MQDYVFRPEVAEKIKWIVKEFDDATSPLFKDWVSRMLIWADSDREYVTWFRMMCGDEKGRMYPTDGMYDASTRVLHVNNKAHRVFEDFDKGTDAFKEALVKLMVDLIDMVSFDVDAIAVDLGVTRYSSIRMFELQNHTYCLGITAFSSAAKDDWGFKGMAKVIGKDLANL